MERAALVQRLVELHRRRKVSEASASSERDSSFGSGSEDDRSVQFASDLMTADAFSWTRRSEVLIDKEGAQTEQVSARKFHRSKEEAVRAYEAVFQASHSFRPAVQPYKGQTLSTESRDSRRVREIQQLRASAVSALWDKECTFQPKILESSRALVDKSMGSISREGVSDRLFTDAHLKAEEREMQRMILESKLVSECTFQPEVNTSKQTTTSPEYKPLSERVGDVQRDRSLRLMQLKARLEDSANAELTFSPSINASSRALASKRLRDRDQDQFLDVGERLQHEGQVYDRRKEVVALELQRQQQSSFTAPKSCTGTDHIARESALVDAAFEDRLRWFEAKYRVNKEHRARAEKAALQTLFCPRLQGGTDRLLRSVAPHLLSESPERRAFRMSSVAQMQHEALLQESERRVYQDLSFMPAIDPLSKELGRASTLDELVSNFRGARKREMLQKRLELELLEQCPFVPVINAGSAMRRGESTATSGSTADYCPIPDMAEEPWAGVTSGDPYHRPNLYLHNPDVVIQVGKARLVKRQDTREREMQIRSIRELQECTFRPSLKRPPRRSSSAPAAVRGLDRFLQLREMSQHLRDEHAAREREVFDRDCSMYRRPEDNSTIVQPFRFHESERRPSTSVGQLLADEAANMSFQPNLSRTECFRRTQ